VSLHQSEWGGGDVVVVAEYDDSDWPMLQFLAENHRHDWLSRKSKVILTTGYSNTNMASTSVIYSVRIPDEWHEYEYGVVTDYSILRTLPA
jgi:hypothetical protein